MSVNCTTECKCAWLTLASFLLGWTCFGRPPSISCRRDIRFTLCARRAAARGGSDSVQRRGALPDLQRDHADVCLRLMGKKLLVSLAMEGKSE